jgi:hydrogenase expression/formation protein HypD
MLLRQIAAGQPKIEIQYTRVVKPAGNPAARRAIAEHFEIGDTEWRGLGVLPKSGLQIRPELAAYDALRIFNLTLPQGREPRGCHCGEVLRGLIEPPACPLFAKRCTPITPVGACMVSSEGTCAAHFKYRRTEHA